MRAVHRSIAVEERSLAVAGGALFLRRTVAAPGAATLVAVHGGPGLSHEPLRLFERLATPALSVALFDQRATGRSSGTIAPVGASRDGAAVFVQAIDDLAAVVAALPGAGPIYLVGHAWGALLSALYAARRPARVASLILIDGLPPTAAGLDAAMVRYGARLREFQGRGLVPADLPSWAQDGPARLLAVLPIYFADPTHPGSRGLGGARFSVAAFDGINAALATHDLRDELARVCQASLQIGTEFPFGLEMAAELAAALTASPARHVTMRGAGHLPFIERPAQLLAEVASFLSHQIDDTQPGDQP
jgi:pimeloyl-ACP methyl ester carboxylesterase